MTIGYRAPDAIRASCAHASAATDWLQRVTSTASTVRSSMTPSLLTSRRRCWVGRWTSSFPTTPGAAQVGVLIGWAVGVQAATTNVAPEEIVVHHYDSASQPEDYKKSKPVLDVSFDVPGIHLDRSPENSTRETDAKCESPLAHEQLYPGASGWGGQFSSSGGSISFDLTGRPITTQLAVEAWGTACHQPRLWRLNRCSP